MDYKFTFTIDASKTGPKGQVHKARIATQVSFTYNSPFYGTPQTGSIKTPVYKTIKFYAKSMLILFPLQNSIVFFNSVEVNL